MGQPRFPVSGPLCLSFVLLLLTTLGAWVGFAINKLKAEVNGGCLEGTGTILGKF